jgi:hypothetical protein
MTSTHLRRTRTASPSTSLSNLAGAANGLRSPPAASHGDSGIGNAMQVLVRLPLPTHGRGALHTDTPLLMRTGASAAAGMPRHRSLDPEAFSSIRIRGDTTDRPASESPPTSPGPDHHHHQPPLLLRRL